ncbi:DUF6973 domain-containing protein [Tenacibaculum piscium]|uniref:DUF6973 domain-containing protein n=2 Tax=Tenacibaculum piscium TaxID=1458515 RepID=UPI001F343007|nr:hypothetical protein [Tenacibaculum piscium]
MKKKITNPLKLVTLCFITSFLWNCEQEENFPTNEKNLAKENFTLKNFKNPFIKENLVVNWNNFNENIGKKTTTYEFTTSFKVPFYVEKRGQKIPIKYKILATKTVADTWDYKLIKLFPSPKSNTKMAKYSNSNAFTGIATHYNLKGEKTQYNTYNKGEIIGSIKNNGNKGIPGRLSFDDIKNLRVPGMLTFKDLYYKNDYNVEHHYGSYMPVRTEHYIDTYYIYTSENHTTGKIDYIGYKVIPKLQYVSHEYTYIPNNHQTNPHHLNIYYEHQAVNASGGSFPPNFFENTFPLNQLLNQDVWDNQNPYDDWNMLTNCEKDFFKSNPLTVPKAIKNKKKAEQAAYIRFGHCKNTSGETDLHNNIGDAYRHAYFSALNTKDMGYTNASKLGDAHECDTPHNRINEKIMDLKNNSWGFNYSLSHYNLTEANFFQDFTTANNNGAIKIIKPCN